MLYDIASAPTAANSIILLTPEDNVAIARLSLAPGQQIESDGFSVRTREAIPAGHKVALR